MIVRRVHAKHVKEVARSVGLRAQERGVNTFVVTPEPGSERYLVERGGYRKGDRYACRHGYTAVIEALLRRFPLAQVETRLTTYDGLKDFRARQPQVMAYYDREYGGEVCTCGQAAAGSTPAAAASGEAHGDRGDPGTRVLLLRCETEPRPIPADQPRGATNRG